MGGVPMIARLKLWWKERGTRKEAYYDAFGLCSVAGPTKVAAEYGLTDRPILDDLDASAIAWLYARRAYNGRAVGSAERGAIDGFRLYARRHP